jgi:hypothetical protein
MTFGYEYFRIMKTCKKCDDITESYSTIGVPKMFTTVVASLGQADTCSREVLQR